MSKRISMTKIFANNRFLLLFSFLVSIIIWFIVTLNVNPNGSITLTKDVVIDTTGTAAGQLGLQVLNAKQKTIPVQIKVSGKRYIISQIKSNDITVVPSLNYVISPGTFPVPMDPVKKNVSSNYSVSVSPRVVEVAFDKFETKTFTVEPDAAGLSASSGLFAELPVMKNASDVSITVTGPTTDVDKITKVVAKANLKSTVASETKDYAAKIILQDSSGSVIDQSNMRLSVQNPSITVAISEHKTVNINPTFSGAPEVYQQNPISSAVDPKQVVISGVPADVDKVSSVDATPIDFTQIDLEHTTFERALLIPDKVNNFEKVSSVKVKVDLSGITSKTLTVNQWKFTNGPPKKLSAESLSPLNGVELLGPKSTIDALTSTDVVGIVDLTDKTKAGEYGMSVVISIPNHPDVWAYGSYQTPVRIS